MNIGLIDVDSHNFPNIDSYVRLVLKTGEVIFSKPDCIVYEEDDEGWETVPTLRFEPWEIGHAKYFKAEDIQSFDEVDKDEIPPFEGDLREPSRDPFLY